VQKALTFFGIGRQNKSECHAGPANVAVRDWSDDFAFSVGDQRYQCCSSVAQFLSPLVSKLHSIDATISGLTRAIEDGDKLLGSVLEAAKAAALRLIPRIGEQLLGFAPLYGIPSFIDLSILNLATNVGWRTSSIIFEFGQRLDAAFPQNSDSLCHISTVSYVFLMY
jgi:hypothetical protein